MPSVFPVNDFGPLMPGLFIGGIAVLHVFLAQFAVGGGFLLCYFQYLAMSGAEPHARQFVEGYFKVLVLVSFVVGAVTGVGVWFATIQVSSATIGSMVGNFHWFWAIEYTFFFTEIVSGYLFYRYHDQLADWASFTLLAIYAFAAWMSLFWINGIISWQLTPGEWLATRSVWDGFFNPSFWPSLLFRTLVSVTLASLAACLVINFMGDFNRSVRRALINRAAHFLGPMIVMPLLAFWYLQVIPEESRRWVLGGSPAMTLFFALAVGASLAIGVYAIFGLLGQRMYINGATAGLLLFLALGATAGGEFVREGSRKPFSIRDHLYSNGISPQEVARLRTTGCTADDPYPVHGAAAMPNDQVRLGAKVYRRLCAICHTIDGANPLRELTANWDETQMRMNISKLQQTKAFMPPFAGNAREVEAVVQFLNWRKADSPQIWPTQESAEVLAQIELWLREAGTEPATMSSRTGRPLAEEPHG